MSQGIDYDPYRVYWSNETSIVVHAYHASEAREKAERQNPEKDFSFMTYEGKEE